MEMNYVKRKLHFINYGNDIYTYKYAYTSMGIISIPVQSKVEHLI